MGVRFHIRVQDVTDDWVDNGSGGPLAREYDRLERLLRKKGFRPLMEFYVPDPEEMVGHDKEEWFNPMEGLCAKIRRLTKALQPTVVSR
jgi:hypothetical protein